MLAALLSAAALAAPPVVVPCGDVIDQIARPPAPPLLGVVVPPPRRLGQFVKVHQDGWTRWRKTPLIVRAGRTPVTVSVPPAWRSRAAIIWGSGTIGPRPALRIAACPRAPHQALGWNVYAGGFFLRSASACVPLTFQVGDRRRTLRFSLGGGAC
jgi:hypothetical protein